MDEMLFSDGSSDEDIIIQEHSMKNDIFSSSFTQGNFLVDLKVSTKFEESKLINSPLLAKSHKSNNIDEVNISVNDIIDVTDQYEDNASSL